MMFPGHKRGRFISRKGIDSKSLPSFLCNCFLYNHSKWNIILKILDKCDSKVKKTQFKVKNNKPKQCVFNPFSAKIKVYPGMLEYCLSLKYKKVGETCIALFLPKVSKSPKKLLQDSQALHLFIFPHSHSYFIQSCPFPKHPYFGQPCPHNSPNLPVLPKTLFSH